MLRDVINRLLPAGLLLLLLLLLLLPLANRKRSTPTTSQLFLRQCICVVHEKYAAWGQVVTLRHYPAVMLIVS